jgi:hypothetical protein
MYDWRIMENLLGGALIGALMYMLGLLGRSFLPAYMQEKGKNLATKEDIQELAKQTAILTQAAKEIEARISMGVWTQQQRWAVQKTTLLESLKELATADTCLYELVYTFRDTKDHSQDRAERREEANKKYADAVNNFRRTQLAMEIVCGAAIGTRFREIDNIFGRTLHAAKRGDFGEIWDGLCLELLAAKKHLGDTIRKQLEFDPQGPAAGAP